MTNLRASLSRAAVLLLVCISLYSLIRNWRSTVGLELGAEALSTWEARLEPARAALPVTRGVVGYVAEWDVPGFEYGYHDLEAEFFLTQYTLAPLILVKGALAEWNVAVLPPEAFAAWERSNGEDFEIRRLEHNVYILHRLEDE
jgi:hypothetical protein